MDQNRAAREDFIDTFTRTADFEVAPQVLQWVRNEVVYTYATELLRYPSIFRDLHNGNRSRNPSASYYSFLEDIPLNNPDAILQGSYQRFLESFISYKLEKPMGWALRKGGERQYSFLKRFFFGPSLYYMQYLLFERTVHWLVEYDYMAEEYQAFMASKAPALLKQKLEKLRKKPPKVYSMNYFDELFDPSIEQGIYPDLLVADENGIIVEVLDWKPPVKRVVEIIDHLP